MTTINQTIKREQRIRLSTVLGIVFMFLAILSLNKDILLSFILAFVLSYLLDPIVTYLERTGLSRTKAVAIPYVLIFGSLFITTYLVTPILASQMTSFQDNLPQYISGIKTLLAKWEVSVNKLFFHLYTLKVSDRLEQHIEQALTSAVQSVPTLATTVITTILLVPIFSFFMLQDGRTILKKLLSIVPNNFFETALNLTHQINEQLGDFIRAKMMESIIVGSTVWLGLYALNFPYAIFLAVIAGITNLIPYVGPIIGALPAFLLAAINPELNSAIVLIAGIYFLAQLIDLVFIIPMVVAKTVNLHPITVLVVIVLGAKAMGVLGMLVAIPVASILKLTFTTLFDHLVHFRT